MIHRILGVLAVLLVGPPSLVVWLVMGRKR